MRIVLIGLALIGASAASAEKPVGGKGFTCVAPNGFTRRLNIDLAAKRYQEAGEKVEKIREINDAKVVLRHYSTIEAGFYLDFSLDRSTLVLSSTTDNGQQHTYVTFQCQMGDPFNFSAERQF